MYNPMKLPKGVKLRVVRLVCHMQSNLQFEIETFSSHQGARSCSTYIKGREERRGKETLSLDIAMDN